MSNEGWSSTPLRPMGTQGGLFSYEQETVHKSEDKWSHNRMKEQRDKDGSPYTRHGASALTPPFAGEGIYLDDLNKSIAGDDNPNIPKDDKDPEKIVKSFLMFKSDDVASQASSAVQDVGNKVKQATSKVMGAVASTGATRAKAVDYGEEEADELEKS